MDIVGGETVSCIADSVDSATAWVAAINSSELDVVGVYDEKCIAERSVAMASELEAELTEARKRISELMSQRVEEAESRVSVFRWR